MRALWNWNDRPDVYLQFGVAGVIPQILQLQAQVTITSQSHVNIRDSVQSFFRVDQSIRAVRAVEVPVLVCLRSSCCHVTDVGGP